MFIISDDMAYLGTTQATNLKWDDGFKVQV